MVQVRIVGTAGDDQRRLGRARPRPTTIRQAVDRVPEPESRAVSQAITSRFGGTLVGGAKKTGQEGARPEADPAGEAARRDRQRLRRAGRGHASPRSSSRRPAGRTPASPATCREQSLFSTSVYYTSPRARLSAERLQALARRHQRLGAPARRAERLRARRRRRRRDRQGVLRRDAAAGAGGGAGCAAAAAARSSRRRSPSDSGQLLPAPEAHALPAALSDEGAARLLVRRGRRDGRERSSASTSWASTARPCRSTRTPRSTPRTPGACATRPGSTRRSSSSRPGRSAGTGGRCASTRTARRSTASPSSTAASACKAAGGVVVWIDNSLDDKLSPETMISIAKSLKPARRAPA